MRIRRVCMVAREMEGIAGAGGLKDVVRGLSDAMAACGVDVTVIIPRYGFVDVGNNLLEFPVSLGPKKWIVKASVRQIGLLRVVLLDAPPFSEKRDVYVYREEDAPSPEDIGIGHHDALLMNSLHTAATVKFLSLEENPPDIIHGHDAHTGMLPLYLRETNWNFFSETAVLVTIHNAGFAYQQVFESLSIASEISGISEKILQSGLVGKQVYPLLIAGIFGNVSTVSPDYADEILSGEDPYSGELRVEYKQRKIALEGIYNGIDPVFWGKNTDSAQGFFSKEIFRRKFEEKLKDSSDFLKECGIQRTGSLPNPNLPYVLFHGRLVYQKGLESLLHLPEGGKDSFPPYQMIVYGQGDREIEMRIRDKVEKRKNWMFLRGYNPELTIELLEASSFVLVPSEWEPCGQIDMAGQLQGALPIVRRVGGLKKIRNQIDGFSYAESCSKKPAGLISTLKLALEWEIKSPEKIRIMREEAENQIYENCRWKEVFVHRYLPLFTQILEKVREKS